MRGFLHTLYRSARRVYPRSVTQSQAVAFNMFLTFFPLLILALGVFSSSVELRAEVREMAVRLRRIMPPGSDQLILAYFARSYEHPWRWILLGLGGTLLAGTQMMKLLVTGFHMMYDEVELATFWRRQARALLLLLATIGPWLASVVLTVFGKLLREWVIQQVGMPILIRALWTALFSAATLVFAMLVLAVVYRLGRPSARGLGDVLPGAAVATLLWWVVNSAFGFYVRHMPYGLVYGGLAAVIGMLIWMQLTAIVIFLGSAFNAEMSLSRKS